MRMNPFGTLHAWQTPDLGDPYEKFSAFNGSDAEYRQILDSWYSEVQEAIWPLWTEHCDWDGKAADTADDGTRAELTVCLDAFQRSGLLRRLPNSIESGVAEANKRDHLWHFRAEDAKYFAKGDEFLPKVDQSFDWHASKDVGLNFQAYSTSSISKEFGDVFWGDRHSRQPAFMSIKNQFQRPRPWTVAMMFGLRDFAWHRADGLTHTGIHPAFPSGHCYQGIVHSANALAHWWARSDGSNHDKPLAKPTNANLDALKQYAVDWGDRRVFAGIHYPTDNIASWVLAVRLLPQMYDHGDELASFAKSAIMEKSEVYRIIQQEFHKHEELHPALDLLNKYIVS